MPTCYTLSLQIHSIDMKTKLYHKFLQLASKVASCSVKELFTKEEESVWSIYKFDIKAKKWQKDSSGLYVFKPRQFHFIYKCIDFHTLFIYKYWKHLPKCKAIVDIEMDVNGKSFEEAITKAIEATAKNRFKA